MHQLRTRLSSLCSCRHSLWLAPFGAHWLAFIVEADCLCQVRHARGCSQRVWLSVLLLLLLLLTIIRIRAGRCAVFVDAASPAAIRTRLRCHRLLLMVMTIGIVHHPFSLPLPHWNCIVLILGRLSPSILATRVWRASSSISTATTSRTTTSSRAKQRDGALAELIVPPVHVRRSCN